MIPGGRTVKPIKSHAGGIAWYKHYLYVAETHVGLRVFDMRYILGAKKLPRTADLGAALRAAAGRLLQAGQGCGADLLVRRDRPHRPALITGKYAGQEVQPPDRALAAGRGLRPARAAGQRRVEDAGDNVQGGLMHNGRLLASSSYDMDGSNGDGELVSGFPTRRPRTSAGPTPPRTSTTPGRATACTRSPRRRGDRVVFADRRRLGRARRRSIAV